jgi:tetratricopeptide (TPR) repeat protein
MWASMSFFFGPQWWKNVRLRTSIFNAYSYTGIVGPGNEHVIIRMVINRAFLRRDYKKACKYAHVFLSYCRKLLERDRFRDVAIAAESVVGIFEDLPDKLIHCQALYMYGRSLHMTHQLSKAIFNLEKALAVNEVENVLNDDFRSDILIVLALCYQGSDRPTDAITAANKVLEISHRESHNSFQANALIANQTLIGGKLVERLKELECESRNKGKKVVADNIAINLSKITKEVNESIHYLQRVLNSGGDVYNRVRAVIEKAEVLGQHKRLSELYEIDRRYLTQAYGYCYAQRFGTLLNRCHRVLWNTCKREGFIDYMFRMFRFSSFYWRLKGEETREHEYLQDLEVIDIQGENIEPREIKIELIYYNKRKSFFHKKS